MGDKLTDRPLCVVEPPFLSSNNRGIVHLRARTHSTQASPGGLAPRGYGSAVMGSIPLVLAQSKRTAVQIDRHQSPFHSFIELPKSHKAALLALDNEPGWPGTVTLR